MQQTPRTVIKRGWPDIKADVPECVYLYFDIREELTVREELIFKCQQVVVPRALKKELMENTRSSHIDIEGCVRRARDTFFWPRMTVELKEYISQLQCEVCLAHRSGQREELILQQEFVPEHRTLLVVSNDYHNYVEFAHLHTVTFRAIIKELKESASTEVSVFAKTWIFEHKTSSSTYAQSNGKAENAVQTVKRLFKKCKTSEDQNSKHFLTSAAHQCKTLLPVADYLLQPSYPTDEETRNSKLIGNKQRQKFYYNKHRKPLEPIATGDTVQMKLPRHGLLARVWARSHVTLPTKLRIVN